VVSFPAHRGDSIGNLAASATASANGTQSPNTPAKAIDGDPASRWASDWTDNQYIQVDLGSAKNVGRAILRWETAYGSSYRIDTSTDGVTWTPAYSTSSGNGGIDNVSFTPVNARYVRMQGVKRGTTYGYSLYELELYSK
jgi:hypothetical protein